MPPLNYKRGLRRVYVTLAAAWVSYILVISFKEMPKPLVPPPPPGFAEEQPKVSGQNPAAPLDYAALAKQAGAIYSQPPPASSADAPKELPDSTQPIPRFRYWSERVAVMLIPPIGGFMLLFLVLPWIWRGFRQD